jgi:hypothetical protein
MNRASTLWLTEYDVQRTFASIVSQAGHEGNIAAESRL